MKVCRRCSRILILFLSIVVLSPNQASGANHINLNSHGNRSVVSSFRGGPSSQGSESDPLTAALTAAIAQHAAQPGMPFYYVEIARRVEGNFGVIYAALFDSETDLQIEGIVDVLGAEMTDLGWSIALPGDTNYRAVLDRLPLSLATALDTSQYESTVEVEEPEDVTFLTDYELPWVHNQWATVTRSYNVHGTGKIDFDIDTDNTSITAAKSGTIVYVNDTHHLNTYSTGAWWYNNAILVRHGQSEYTGYLHVAHNSVPSWIKSQCSSDYSQLNCSVPISAGQIIAIEGSTGNASAPHLHWESGQAPGISAHTDNLDEDGDGNTTELVHTGYINSRHNVAFIGYTVDQVAAWPYGTRLKATHNSACCGCSLSTENRIPLIGEMLNDQDDIPMTPYRIEVTPAEPLDRHMDSYNDQWKRFPLQSSATPVTAVPSNPQEAVASQYPDSVAPIGVLTLGSRTSTVTTLPIVLQIHATEESSAGVGSMRFSRDGQIWTEWEPYAQWKQWQLEDTPDLQTVYAQVQDAAGNVSETMQASVRAVLDTSRPSSPNYTLARSVFGMGGGEKTSAGYIVNGTSGQIQATSQMHSSGYQVASGFWAGIVTSPCYDFGGEPGVGIYDIITVSERWNGTYDPTFDLDHDGDIDIVDIMMVAAAWGHIC